MLNFHVTLSVFAVIFIAELPDKTALASLVLATRHPPLPVWIGASLALTVQSIVAVTCGSLLSLLPAHAVHVGSGVVFLISAIFMWRRHDEADGDAKDDKLGFWRTISTTFGVVFIAEWGDLTQIGTAALAARYRAPFSVLLGAMVALWAVAGIAVFVGNRAGKLLDPNLTKRVAAVVFAAVGVLLVANIL
ncbi:MAG TPA: TMEM165/GDT1 family protein [Polyangia bacterium]|jgi:putative Ca2+/H+ antiporter (TMEM165/GDT1 family)